MNYILIILTGAIFGLGAVILVKLGNPGNYGFCAACHLRDIVGALGLHKVNTLQYARPEILGWILGAFAVAKYRGKFHAYGGARPIIRFILGVAMMLGALVFLGCPLRAILRLAGGDLNDVTALGGFVSGIAVGIQFLKRGYNLGETKEFKGNAGIFGYIAVIFAIIILVGAAIHTPLLQFSEKGPGSMHAPLAISLIAGLVAGALAYLTRMCLSGGFRDYLLVKDTYLLRIYFVLFCSALAANLYFGFFKLGFTDQPLAHTLHVWNFLGLFLVGIAATLCGGCPLRQLILSGTGNTDALASVLGMMTGAVIAHTLNAAGSAAGVGINGQIAVIAGILVCLIIGIAFREKIASAR